MSDAVTTSVELSVSPEVAFHVFVREIDAWYRVDRRALPDLTRTAAIRFEPRLGGRLLDVHDLASGAGRELARITAWEPGRRLVFVDNEGTEVEVTFERRGQGTRVTLTHRGLERLAPGRAAALRRSGWAALTHLYRDHLAPSARPAALAAGFVWLTMAIVVAVWVVLGQPSGGWMLAGFLLVLCAILVAVPRIEWRLARRWVASEWSYRRIKNHVFGLTFLGLLAWSLYGVIEHGDDLIGIGAPLLSLTVWLLVKQDGPAGGASLRRRVDQPRETFLERHPDARLFLLLAGAAAAGVGASFALDTIDAQLADLVLALLIAALAANMLRTLISRHRERKALGFNPDYYLAVDRRISEENRRPELLIHRPSKKPEYSGWYAYAHAGGERPGDLVAWSMKDLIDHSPEAVHPLREGRGRWRWDEHLGTYRPVASEPGARAVLHGWSRHPR